MYIYIKTKINILINYLIETIEIKISSILIMCINIIFKVYKHIVTLLSHI